MLANFRPLFMEFPNEKGLLAVEDQFMLGESIMVKAIGQPGQEASRVRFPKGTDWYDFYTHDLMNPDNEGYIDIDLNADKIPAYVRGGSILVKMEKPVKTSAEFKDKAFTLYVYVTDDHKMTASTTLYLDDGMSTDYMNGKYVNLQINHQNNKLTWTMKNHLPENLKIKVNVDKVVIAGEDEPLKVQYMKEESGQRKQSLLKYEKQGNLLVIYTNEVNFLESGSIYLSFDHEDL